MIVNKKCINKFMKTKSNDIRKWVAEAKKHRKKPGGVRHKTKSLHDKGLDAWNGWKTKNV